MLSYEMPSHRKSWTEHDEEGWYIGQTRNRDQCYQVVIKRISEVRTPLRLKFFPEKSKITSNPSTDRIVYTTRQLTQALNNPSPSVPYEHIRNETTTALTKLAEILGTGQIIE